MSRKFRSAWKAFRKKISKGIRDVFGGKTQEEKEEFPEESMDMVNEAGITRKMRFRKKS